MYDLNKISRYLKTEFIGKTIIQYEELTSASVKAKNVFTSCPDGTVILTENQSRWKVRFGRKWICMPGNIYLSIILKPQAGKYKLSEFESIASAAVCKSVEETYNLQCKIKWPNDILISGKKISSVASDVYRKKNKEEGIIISIGINVVGAHESSDEDMKSNISDLQSQLNEKIERELLIAYILNNLGKYYEELRQFNSISTAVGIYNDNFELKGKTVEVMKPGKKTVRRVKVGFIDCKGRLIVEDSVGKRKILDSGETIIRL